MGAGARYKALIEHLPDVMLIMFDTDLRIVLIEGGAVSRWPDAPEDIVGRRLDELLRPDRFGAVESAFRAALGGERVSLDYEDSDGVTVWWTAVAPVFDETGAVVGGISRWRDVTPRVEAERALEQYARELERSNAELEQFAYIASHDLSEPLSMVTGYLNLLERRYGAQLDEDARQFIGFAVDGAVRMRGLIDDLLAYSRVGRAELDRDQINAQELVEAAFHTVTAEREGPEPALLASDLPVVTGDAGQLAQLFQNLLSNAIKFTEPGHAPVVEVTAELLEDGSGWRFVVADEGIGIALEQAERVFGMFQRLHTRDEFPGSGVGLAIARKVAERHGGHIRAEPRRGGGTRIVFELRSPQ